MSSSNMRQWAEEFGTRFADFCRGAWSVLYVRTAGGTKMPSWLGRMALSALLFVVLWGVEAWARPGGGHTYSGGGRSSGGGGGGYHGGGSSGGGGGGGGELVFYLLLLAFHHPVIGVPLIIAAVAVLWWIKSMAPSSSDEWSSMGGYDEPSVAAHPAVRVDMSELRVHDKNFSQQVFEDFMNNLYVRSHQARVSAERMGLLSPYLSEQARSALLGRRGGSALEDVTAVVVGSQRVIGWSGADQDPVRVSMEFEANYTERFSGDVVGDYYVREIWTLERKRDVESRRPDQVSDFECPNCGAPVEGSQDERCAYCGAHFGSGEFDWFVTAVALQEESRTPPRLTGGVEEQGTSRPTVYDPNLEQGLAALRERDPAFGPESIQPRIQMIFAEMQQAWSSLEWEKARPYLTDRLFLSMSYWVDAYRKSGLRNITTDNRITNVEFVKVVTDPFFDIVTVRLYASGHDYTVDASGNVVSGSKDRERSYSEYWTLVRSVQSKGTDKDPKTCPNCGAPLSINQTGHCEYCGSKVTGGDFDWVLSRIEQDDSY